MENNTTIKELADYSVLQQGVIDIRSALLKALSYIYMNRVSYDTEIDGVKKRVTAHRVDAAPLFLNTLDNASNILTKTFTSSVDNKVYTYYDYCNNISKRDTSYSKKYSDLIKILNIAYISSKHYLGIIYSLSKADLSRVNQPLSENSIFFSEDKVKQLINILKLKTRESWEIFAELYTDVIDENSTKDVSIQKEDNKALAQVSSWIEATFDIISEIIFSNDFITNESE